MKNQRDDSEFDDDLDNDDDIDTDDFDDDDNDDSGSQTDDSDTDAGDDDEPDEDGYTKAERAELDKLKARHKSASDKISQDGQRIKELERENEELKRRQSGHRRDDTRQRTPETRTPRTRTRTRTSEDDEDIDVEDIDFSDIDVTKLDPNTRKALERMYDSTLASQRKARSVEDKLLAAEQENAELKQDEERYLKYRDHYGLSRDQYAEMRAERDAGNDIEADRILQIHSTAAKRRQEREGTISDTTSYLPHGSSDAPPARRRKSREQELQEEFDKAPDNMKEKVSQKIWEELDADVASRITLPSPVS